MGLNIDLEDLNLKSGSKDFKYKDTEFGTMDTKDTVCGTVDSIDLDFFRDGLRSIGISFREKEIQQFLLFYQILLDWNRKMNLTSITNWRDVVVKHFLDSLSLAQVMDLTVPARVLDLGTGAGFPGIPLKIAFPDLDMVLLDSVGKKVKFLGYVIERLNLSGIRAVHGRAEDYGRQEGFRESFDLCFSRAVSRLASLCEYCLPFVKVGGLFVAYKSGDIELEVRESRKAISILGGKLAGIHSFDLAGMGISRSFVFIKKKKETPLPYPRKAGIPSRNPILS